MVKNTLVHHNYEIGVFSKSAFSKLLLKDSTFIENGNSTFHLQLHNGAQTTGEIIVENSLVIGEHEASRDCTDKYELSIKNKTAIYSSIGIESVNSAAFQYPTKGWHKVEHDSIRGNTCTFTKVIFKDFPGSGTKCIATRPVLLFQIHPQASDLIMEHIFSNIALNNVNADTLLYLMDPPEEWVDPTDCVGFVCTGPQNVLLSFKEHVNQTGTTSIKLPPKPFDIISDNPGFNTALSSSCNLVPSWNANNCTGDDMALLQFESLDPDRLDRSVQPVYVSQGENNLKIKLNSFMDHIWDGFYTGQKKLLRFPALVKVNTDNFHIIKYEGTPPLNQLFELYGTEAASDALKLRLLYSNPDYVQVEVGGNVVDRKALTNGTPLDLSGTVCGQNRWIHTVNQLEFTLLSKKHGCSVVLKTKQSIALSVRIDMKIDDFYANDGESNFIDRMAASLNIPQSRIRIVGVYTGSIVIESHITEDPSASNESDSIQEIENLSSSLQTLANEGSLLGDWNVLDMSVTVNTYPGGVVTVTIPPMEPSETMSVSELVLLVVLGLIAVSAIGLVIMYIMNRKKLKAGGLHALVFNRHPKVISESEEGKADGVYQAKVAPQCEDSIHMEDVSMPRAVQ